jgi:dihydrofolate reductase
LGKLRYASNMSLDGFTESQEGVPDWAPPDDDVFAFTTEIMRSAGTYLYRRRMYESMAVWETDPALAERSDLTAEFARVWQGPDKVVFSTTLAEVPTARTRLEHSFDVSAVRDLKEATEHDLLVGGPHLAAQALAAGLVDEVQLLLWPVVVGGRNPALHPEARTGLELIDEHRFDNGVMHLRYRTVR